MVKHLCNLKKYMTILSYAFFVMAIANHQMLAQSEASPTKLQITGGMTPAGLERLGKPISIITHEELLEKSEPTIGELLASQPGVSGTYFGPGASRPVIRGQAKERVRVLENSLAGGDVSRLSDDHAVSVDPLSVQRVDVLRGPSTLMYGSSAIGGVVNMIDESIAEENIGKSLTGEIDFRKGDSADDEVSGATSLNGSVGNINWHLSGFYRDTDDIEIPGYAESDRLHELEEVEGHLEEEHKEGHMEGEEHEQEESHEEERASGTLPNSDTFSKGVKLGTSKVWGNNFWGVALKVYNSEYGIPGEHSHEHEGEEDLHTEDRDEHEAEAEEEAGVRIDLEQVRIETRGKIDLNGSFFKTLNSGISYSDYVHKELEGEAVGTRFDNRAFELRTELTHQHDDGFEGGVGVQINWEELEAKGEEAFVPNSDTFNPAIFAVEDYKLSENLIWQLGGRYEYANVNPVELGSQNFDLFSASTGVVWSFGNNKTYSLGTNLAYSERAPSSTELFADGPHVATQSFEVGSASLAKEQSVGAEVVLRKSEGRLTGSASLFWQKFYDYISLNPTGSEQDGFQVFNYESEQAEFRGFEVEADLNLLEQSGHAVSLYGQVDYVRAENLSSNTPLPRVTPLRGKIGLKYSYENISSYIENLMVDEQDRVALFELPTNSYNLLNAGLSYALPTETPNDYEIYFRATNLTDQEARVHNSFLKDVAPLRGRAMMAGVRVRF